MSDSDRTHGEIVESHYGLRSNLGLMIGLAIVALACFVAVAALTLGAAGGGLWAALGLSGVAIALFGFGCLRGGLRSAGRVEVAQSGVRVVSLLGRQFAVEFDDVLRARVPWG